MHNLLSRYLFLITHLVILVIAVRWVIDPDIKEWEPLIVILSTFISIISSTAALKITDPYIKYYYETHPDTSDTGSFYTLIAIWNYSAKKMTHGDFVQNYLPVLNIGAEAGDLISAQIEHHPNIGVFTLNKTGNSEYSLGFDFLEPREHVIIKIRHTSASAAVVNRTDPDESVKIYKVDAWLRCVYKESGGVLQRTNKDDIYFGSPYVYHVFMTVLAGIYLLFFYSLSSYDRLQFVQILCFAIVTCLALLTLFQSELLIPKWKKTLRSNFIKCGGMLQTGTPVK